MYETSARTLRLARVSVISAMGWETKAGITRGRSFWSLS